MLFRLLPILLLFCALLCPPAGAADPKTPRPYVVYAEFKLETVVDLSDGAQWAMDPGDCFPIYMFKDQQTQVVLQLGSATFMVGISRVRILKESDSPRALISYRKNLESYLKSKSEKWQKDAATAKPVEPPAGTAPVPPASRANLP